MGERTLKVNTNIFRRRISIMDVYALNENEIIEQTYISWKIASLIDGIGRQREIIMMAISSEKLNARKRIVV